MSTNKTILSNTVNTRRKSAKSLRSAHRPFSIRPPDKPIPKATGFGHPHTVLLETSRQLLDQARYRSAAVVMAQTACEVFTEVAFATILKNMGLESLDEPLSKLARSFNLTNVRVRKLYVALSQDSIHQTSFWNGYIELVELRNKVVHKGKLVTAQQARDSYLTATQMIRHLERSLQSKYPRSTWIWKST